MPRRRLTLLALAVLVSAFAATTLGAAAAQPPSPASASSSHNITTAPGTPVDDVAAAAAPVAGDVQQTVAVGVHAGTLSVAPADVAITLTRDASTGVYRGVLPRVTVTDGRGTLAGWTLASSINVDDAGATISVAPATPTVVAGFPDGIAAGQPAQVANGGVATLATATAGEGGGTFATSGSTITVRTTHTFSAPLVAHIALVVR